MSSVVCDNGIYYTVYKDHAMVGKEGSSLGNAYNSTFSNKNLEIKSSINDVEVTEIQTNAFRLISGFTSIQFPDTIKNIKESAFDGSGISFIIQLPKNLEVIAKRAFAYETFESIHIPASVKVIETSAFGSNPFLKSITIDSENKNYVVTSDGCLYNSMKTILVQTLYGVNSLVLEPTLVEINHISIDHCTNEELIFPVTFSRITSNYAVYCCSNLKTVKFLGNLFSIPTNAFYSCENLANIFYYGTKSVKIKMFSNSPTNISVCDRYKSDKFATLAITQRYGPCPQINQIKAITKCIRSRRTFQFIPISFIIVIIS